MGSPGSAVVIAAALLWNAVVLAVPAARADVVYEQRITSSRPAGMGPASARNRVYVKSGRERSEMSVEAAPAGPAPAATGEFISITRLDRGLIWYLDPAKKVYSETTFAELKKSFAAAPGVVSDGSAAPASEVRIERPGKRDVICGAPAELVILTIASPLTDPALQGATQYIVAELWMATDFPGAAELQAHARAAVDAAGFAHLAGPGGAGPLGQLLKRLADEIKKLDGTAVRTVLSLEIDASAGVAGLTSPAPAHAEGRQVILAMTTEMTKIESKQLPPDLFEIPAGYVKAETPAPGKRPG
jgi:hypothetical protein